VARIGGRGMKPVGSAEVTHACKMGSNMFLSLTTPINAFRIPPTLPYFNHKFQKPIQYEYSKVLFLHNNVFEHLAALVCVPETYVTSKFCHSEITVIHFRLNNMATYMGLMHRT
jgi:hypothetical protein